MFLQIITKSLIKKYKMQNKKYRIQSKLLMKLRKISKIAKVSNSRKQKKKLENQNGKILLKHYQETKNLFHLKIRNHKKSMNYSKIILTIQQLLQYKQKIRKMNNNKNYLNKIIKKQLKRQLMQRMK